MENNELSMAVILKIIKLYKFKMAKIVFVILLITTGLFFVVPYKYSADAVILPPEEESMGGGLGSFLSALPGGGSGASLLGMASGGGSSTKARLYSSMLRSRTICHYVIDKNNLDSNQYFKKMPPQMLVKFLQKSIFTDVQKNGMIDVELELNTPFFATKKDKQAMANLSANIINSAIAGLDSVIRAQSQQRSSLSKNYIELELQNYAKRLDSIERQLEMYQSNNKVLEIEEQMKYILEQAIAMGAGLGEAKVELAIAEAQFQSTAPQLISLKQKYNTLAEQYSRIQTGGLVDGDAFGISLANVPKLTREYTILFRDKKIIEEVMLYLETLKHQEAISINKELPSITILDPAEVPFKKTAPKYSMMYIFAFIFGWLFALAWAFYKAAKAGMITIKKEEVSTL